MTLTRRFFLLFGLLLLTSTFYLPRRYELTYPQPLGPQLDDYIQRRYRNAVEDDLPDLVLVGDSVLELGVNQDQLAELTGKKVYKIGLFGAASAEWYLIIKNNILQAEHKPRVVIIFFRDSILTAPAYRVTGKYFQRVDELATPDDSVLLQKAYINTMNPLEKWADQYLPLYISRLRIRETLDFYLRYSLPRLAGCDTACTDNATLQVFQENNIDEKLLVDAVATAESYLYTSERLDFHSQVDKSFLPDILQLARENGVSLILVRTKNLFYPDAPSEPLSLRRYIQNFKTYAEENGVIVLDFAHDERLTPGLFYDPLHFTEEGARVFTNLLAEALAPYIQK
jgi:hypothetical protein